MNQITQASKEIQNDVANIQYYVDKIKSHLTKVAIDNQTYENVININVCCTIINDLCKCVLDNLNVKEVNAKTNN